MYWINSKQSLEDRSASSILFIKFDDGCGTVAEGATVLSVLTDELSVGICGGLFVSLDGSCDDIACGVVADFTGTS